MTLANARWERFAQALAEGKPANEAYVIAGYEYNEGNASRLKGNEKVSARVTELLTKAAERAEVTIYDIADQLDEDRAFAKDCKAPSACVAATMGKAKVFGHLTDKVEQKTTLTVEDMTDHDLAKLIAYQLFSAGEETVQ